MQASTVFNKAVAALKKAEAEATNGHVVESESWVKIAGVYGEIAQELAWVERGDQTTKAKPQAVEE